MTDTPKTPNQLNIEGMTGRMTEIEEKSGSPTMCLAKWLQSTVYLMNGHTHSCHHPQVHKIPISEIKRNPSALHNTEFKIEKRKEMLAGQRPKECQYCWNVEDLPGKHMSDRTYKSSDMGWAYPHLQKVLDSREGQNIAPSYLEVAFDNTCNLKCMYCSPDISSKWAEESKQHGPYKGTQYNVGDTVWLQQIGRMPIPNRDENPYVDAFWEWWPELYQSLDTFRITGGEPLLSKNTWRVLEEVKKNPRKDFTLAINTNMQVPKELLDRLIKYHNEIAPHIKAFDIYTSAEATGRQSDYIRFGMEYSSFLANCRRFLTETHQESRLNFMVTFNMLSLSTFKDFLKDIWEMRRDFNPDDAMNRVPMMINYLRWPQFQDVRMAPQGVKDQFMDEIEAYMNAHMRYTSPEASGRFYLEERDQIARLRDYMNEPLSDAHRDAQMSDFGAFYPEYDRRKSVDFQSTFPELAAYYQECVQVFNAKNQN